MCTTILLCGRFHRDYNPVGLKKLGRRQQSNRKLNIIPDHYMYASAYRSLYSYGFAGHNYTIYCVRSIMNIERQTSLLGRVKLQSRARLKRWWVKVVGCTNEFIFLMNNDGRHGGRTTFLNKVDWTFNVLFIVTPVFKIEKKNKKKNASILELWSTYSVEIIHCIQLLQIGDCMSSCFFLKK